MPVDLRAIPFAQRTFLAGWALLCIGLFFSPFLASAGTVLFLLALVLDSKAWASTPRHLYVLYGAPLVLVLTDLLRDVEPMAILDKSLLAFGFFLIGMSIHRFGHALFRYYLYSFGIFIGLVLVTDLITVGNYFIHKEEMDVLLLQSKSIPVFGGMHHIHFGVLNALCIGGLLYVALILKVNSKNYLLGLAAVLLICFHILSSRTGLLSFYMALFLVLLLYTVREKAYMVGLLGLALLIAVNAIALMVSSSFQNKLKNSMEDIQSWEGQPEDVNFKSMAMRLEAYRMSWAIIAEHPFNGVGEVHMDEQMQEMYDRMESPLYKENRVGPHNQLLEYGVKYGIWGMAFVLFYFLYWFMRAIRPLDYGALGVVLMLASAVQFESLFERQVGIFICAGLLSLIHAWSNRNIRTT